MKRPVFVVGCPRSGTTLLYSMLVASGGFAFYRKETYFYDLEARFPSLTSSRSRQEFLDKFLAGYLGRVPGLDVEPIAQKAVAQCERTSEFLPRLYDSNYRTAGDGAVDRGDTRARSVHGQDRAGRAGRRVRARDPRRPGLRAVDRSSGLGSPLPWDARWRVGVAALFWEWMVRSGWRYGCAHPRTYMEVHF